jgi:hypothetical protein
MGSGYSDLSDLRSSSSFAAGKPTANRSSTLSNALLTTTQVLNTI